MIADETYHPLCPECGICQLDHGVKGRRMHLPDCAEQALTSREEVEAQRDIDNARAVARTPDRQ